ncbi:MAG: hypothetical protein ABEH58_04740 [Haloplanus sp.]
MEKERLVLGAHVVVALGMLAFGAYRVSRGNVVPGSLNMAMAAAIAGVGVYMTRLA